VTSTPLNKSRGKVHDYLGMIFDFSKLGLVTISMSNYIATSLHEVPKDMKGVATTPAVNQLFTVNNEIPVKLNANEDEIFVRIVMQLLTFH
jgi:hypothetical protein